MAILSNINGLFAVEDNGAIKFNNLTGTNNQVLIANTNSSPTWVDVDTIIGGPYLPLTGGTLAGAGNLVVGGTLTVNGIGTFNTPAGGVAFNLDAAADNYGTFRLRTNGDVSKWDIGMKNDNDFYIYNQATSAQAFEIDTANNNATFAGNVELASGTTLFGMDTLRLVNGSNKRNLSCDGSGNLDISNAANNATIFHLQDGALTLGTSIGTGTLSLFAGAATFAGNVGVTGEISASDDINTTGKLFVNKTGAELRLKSTSDTGESYINFADPSDNNVGQIFYGHSNNRMIFRVNDDERMRIDSSGNVGIGGAPSVNFEVNKTGARVKLIDGTNQLNMGLWDSVNYRFEGDANRPMFFTSYQGNINFGISGGTTMTIKSSTVGIGDTSAPNTLSVKDTGNLVCRFTGGTTFSLIQNNTDSTVIFSANHGNASPVGVEKRFIWQMAGGTAKMKLDDGTLTVSADLIAYGSPSDKRLKENIKPINSALEKVTKLQGVTFDWKDKKQDKAYDPDQNWKHDIGFIAQDVQKVIPELVRKNENELLSMRHQGVIPILVEAIKELEARVKELENK